MSEQTKRRIFISYQRKHEEDIRALVDVLEAENTYDVWYDKKMATGKWWDQILQHIRWSDIVILALAESYFESEACRRELAYARATHRAILPVIVDPELDYDEIPPDISALQIEQYFGKTAQFVKLRKNLNEIALRPLPDPLPYEPPPPIDTTPPVSATRSNMGLFAGIAVAVVMIGVVGVILLTLLNDGSSGNDDPTSGAVIEEAPDRAEPIVASVVAGEDDAMPTVTVTPTLTPIPVSEGSVPVGAFNITLVYGDDESLVVVVNAESDLNGIELRTFDPQHTAVLTQDFTGLMATNGVVGAGTCLIYELTDANPRRPLACDDAQNFITDLTSANIFWFNTNSNRFLDVGVYRNNTLVDLCPHNNGSGQCTFSGG